jgi:hypothetical protein
MYHHKKKNLSFLCFFFPLYFSYHFICICVCVFMCVCVCPEMFLQYISYQISHCLTSTNKLCVRVYKTDRSLRKSFKETGKKREMCTAVMSLFLPNVLLSIWICHCHWYLFIARSHFVLELAKDYRNSRLRLQCMENDDSTSRSI